MIRSLQPIEVFNQWQRIKPLINKALDTALYDADDLKPQCLSGLMRVYVSDDYSAACTVELKQHPKMKIAVIHTLGGENMNEWFDEGFQQIINDAKANGAQRLEINGRRGWLKKLPNFKEQHTTMAVKI